MKILITKKVEIKIEIEVKRSKDQATTTKRRSPTHAFLSEDKVSANAANVDQTSGDLFPVARAQLITLVK